MAEHTTADARPSTKAPTKTALVDAVNATNAAGGVKALGGAKLTLSRVTRSRRSSWVKRSRIRSSLYSRIWGWRSIHS